VPSVSTATTSTCCFNRARLFGLVPDGIRERVAVPLVAP
jgi:hypothetical protein